MTRGLTWWESSTTCDRRRHYSSGRILVLRLIHQLVMFTPDKYKFKYKQMYHVYQAAKHIIIFQISDMQILVSLPPRRLRIIAVCLPALHRLQGSSVAWRRVSHLPSTVAALAAEVLAVGQ